MVSVMAYNITMMFSVYKNMYERRGRHNFLVELLGKGTQEEGNKYMLNESLGYTKDKKGEFQREWRLGKSYEVYNHWLKKQAKRLKEEEGRDGTIARYKKKMWTYLHRSQARQ